MNDLPTSKQGKCHECMLVWSHDLETQQKSNHGPNSELCSKLTPTFEDLVAEQTTKDFHVLLYFRSFVELNSRASACLFCVTVPLSDCLQGDGQK